MFICRNGKTDVCYRVIVYLIKEFNHGSFQAFSCRYAYTG